jgi:hypothetical protein
LGPSTGTLGLAGKDIVEVFLHERRIGQRSIQYRLSQPTGRGLPAAVHAGVDVPGRRAATALVAPSGIHEPSCRA